jgi:alpha-tubulin suppressor-like RCC1 family protein
MIDAGGYHTCGIASDGSLHCWGRNDKDQVGQDGVYGPNNSTQLYQDVAAGELHTCALRTDGIHIDCWGDQSLDQTSTTPTLGHHYYGADNNSYHPVSFTSLSSFGHHTCAEVNMAPHTAANNTPGSGVATHTSVVCWGSDENGQVSDAPVNSGEFTNYSDIDLACAGGRHNCVYVQSSTGNELHCWGDSCQAQTCFDQPGSCTFEPACSN